MKASIFPPAKLDEQFMYFLNKQKNGFHICYLDDTWKSTIAVFTTHAKHFNPQATSSLLPSALAAAAAAVLCSLFPDQLKTARKKKVHILLPPLKPIKAMSITTLPPAAPQSFQHLCSHAPFRILSSPSSPPMTLLKLKPQRFLSHLHRHRRRFSVAAAAVRQDITTFASAPLVTVSPAAESLFHVIVDVSDSPDVAASYTKAGQYLQLRVPDSDKPSFLAIASPPSVTATKGVFEFLIKTVPGSTAELLCGLQKGDAVELSQAMGKGFQIDQISPPENYQTVLIFATGSGISPIRSMIESGFSADKRSDVRLYYGARNLRRMAYQDRFRDWEYSGVEIVPVLSQPNQTWTGEQGYVQAAFARAKRIFNPQSTGAVLCGQRPMAEEVTSLLLSEGVSTEKILKNF